MIAIVIPYYKKVFFRKTLTSLANQTDKRFTVYIGDDASPENPKDLIAEFSGKFNLKYKRFKNNIGKVSLTQQWDRCIALSEKEEWIMILGDDDYYGANLVESFYKNYQLFNGKANVVRFAKQPIFNDGKTIADIQYNPALESAASSFYRRITGKTTSTLSEYAFTRKTYNKFGFYDYPLAWQSDNRAWIEFSDNKHIYSINEAVVHVISSTESISGSTMFSSQKRKANLRFFNHLIYEKLNLFDKEQSIRILHKYENEIKYKEKMTFKRYALLFPYYLRNFEPAVFKQYLKKMIKSLFN